MKTFLTWTPDKPMVVQLREKLDQQYQDKLNQIEQLQSVVEKEASRTSLDDWYHSSLEKLEDSARVEQCPTKLQTNYISMLARLDCAPLEDSDKLEMMMAYGVMIQRNLHWCYQEEKDNLILAAVGAKLSYQECLQYASVLGDFDIMYYITSGSLTLEEQVNKAISLLKGSEDDSSRHFEAFPSKVFSKQTGSLFDAPKKMIK